MSNHPRKKGGQAPGETSLGACRSRKEGDGCLQFEALADDALQHGGGAVDAELG